MTFTCFRAIFWQQHVACSIFIFILFENISWGFIEKNKIFIPQLVISSEKKTFLDGWKVHWWKDSGNYVVIKDFLCIFSTSQVDCLWIVAKKNNLSGAAFKLIKFKMFSEGLRFTCISVWCGQMKEWLWNGLGFFFMMHRSTFPEKVQCSGPVKT